LLFLVAIIAVVLLFWRTAISYWVDLLWFRSLGYEGVFWKARGLEWGIFAGFFAATFLILIGIFSALRHAHDDDLPSDHTIYLGGQPITLSLKPVLRIISIGGSLAVALLAGGTMAAEWETLALWWYVPRGAGGAGDPIFGRPLDFYLFTLPAWQLILGWLLTLSIIACVIAVVFLLVSGSARALSAGRGGLSSLPWRGVSLSIGSLLLVVAGKVYVSRFENLFEHHTIFDGVTYTDAHVTLTGLLVVSLALVLGALIAWAGGIFAPRGRWLLAAVVPAVVSYTAVAIMGWYVTSFEVKPNELVREQPYIANNIAMTQHRDDSTGLRP
jgi:uncharacterized membrane protein (UPF0182 family)